jgi:two-component system nitrogen regulation response regulator NtrX
MIHTRPVLLVDDDEALRTTVAEVLVDEGYEVLQACTGAEALELTRQSFPGLILLDTHMPIMNGAEFIRAYKLSQLELAPIVVCSAGLNESGWAGEAGADGFLAKPFSLEQLLDVAGRFVRANEAG